MTAKIRSGGILSETMDLQASKGEVQLSQTYAPSGMPLQAQVRISQGAIKALISIDYTATGVKVTASSGGKGGTKNYPYPSGANLKERNNFWFVSIHPRVGTSESYSDFDVQAMAWKAKTTKYVGDEKLQYHGHLVNTHKVISTDDTTWLGDDGLPYRSENRKSGDLVQRI